MSRERTRRGEERRAGQSVKEGESMRQKDGEKKEQLVGGGIRNRKELR